MHCYRRMGIAGVKNTVVLTSSSSLISIPVSTTQIIFSYTLLTKKIVLLFLPPSFDDFYLVNKDIRDIF